MSLPSSVRIQPGASWVLTWHLLGTVHSQQPKSPCVLGVGISGLSLWCIISLSPCAHLHFLCTCSHLRSKHTLAEVLKLQETYGYTTFVIFCTEGMQKWSVTYCGCWWL